MDHNGRFDSLLRTLVAFDLVEKSSEDGRSRWRLSAMTEQRLERLARESAPVETQPLVFLDHPCSGCGRRCLTRLREGGRYTCDTCAETQAPPPTMEPLAG